MRNDARPIGENAHDQSPIARESPGDPHAPDAPEPVTHDRQSHIVHRKADEADSDPVMPAGGSSLNTKI